MTKNNSLEDRIKKALDNIRPMLRADGGDVSLAAWDEETGTVSVQLSGMCVGCPMAQVTLNEGIAKEIKKAVPEVKEVLSV